jgi:hypothetical protein
MRQPELSHSEHAFIVQCCDEAFKCLFKNYDTGNINGLLLYLVAGLHRTDICSQNNMSAQSNHPS